MLALRISGIEVHAARMTARDAGVSVPEAMGAGRAAAKVGKDQLPAPGHTRPHALGGKRTHICANAAKSVSNPRSQGEEKVSFTINQVGLAQRWLGGTIRAGAGSSSATGAATKYLAVLARAESYGRAPSEFD